MISTIEIEARLQELKPVLKARFHVSRIGYFGSYSVGKQTEQSDIDLLVEFSQPIGWAFFTLEKYLEKSLGLRVDLVTHSALTDRIKTPVLNQVKYI